MTGHDPVSPVRRLSPKRRGLHRPGVILPIALALAIPLVTAGLWWKGPSLHHRWLKLTAAPAEPAGLLPNQEYVSVVFVGQSNAANHGGSRASAADPHRAWYEGAAYRLRDPLPGCSGVGGSVGSHLAMTTNHHNHAWLIACVAQGSTSIAEWSPSGQHFPALAAAVHSLARRDVGPNWIIIHQGEADAWLGTDGKTYEAGLRDLIHHLTTLAPNARIILCQTSLHTADAQPNKALRAAQESVWQAFPNVWAGVDTDSFPYRTRTRGGVHFNAEGLALFATLLKQAMDSPSDTPWRYGDQATSRT